MGTGEVFLAQPAFSQPHFSCRPLDGFLFSPYRFKDKFLLGRDFVLLRET
jgi:hypothetical protein